MFFLMVWIISIVFAVYIADQKHRSVVGYFLLSLFTGPLAVIIVGLMYPRKDQPLNGRDELQIPVSLNEAKAQLIELKKIQLNQEVRIKNLERVIDELSKGKVVSEPVQVIQPEPVVAKMSTSIEANVLPKVEATTETPKSNMELDFARNWLNKIGIVVLALGLAFLISYTFKYFGPFLKIAFGYIVAVVLFFVGIKFEASEKLKNYARALIGGAWAIVYFTTYAMHHFPASRIIESQQVDLFLLIIVVIGMITHALRYKSQEMMAVALFVAYLTSAIGEINYFTLASIVCLAILGLFLVYRFQWIKILAMGIIWTYALHIAWIMPHVMYHSVGNYMNLIFLSSYLLVFFVGIHLLKTVQDPKDIKTLAAINFGNTAFYIALGYPLISQLMFHQRFEFVAVMGIMYLLAGLAMKKADKHLLYIADIVAAAFLLTFAIALKFKFDTTLLLWLIEIPCLLFIGLNFKERMYTYFSYALSVFVVIQLLFFGGFNGYQHMHNWFLWASLSMSACFYLMQSFKEDKKEAVDVIFDHLYSLGAALFAVIWMCSWIAFPWASPAFISLGAILFGLSYILGFKRFRAYGYIGLIIGSFLLFSEGLYNVSFLLKWFIISFDVLVILAIYHAIKYLRRVQPEDINLHYEEGPVFTLCLLMLIFVMHFYVTPQWVSLAMGVTSVVMILIGFVGANKIERIGGMIMLALTLARVVLIDLGGLDIVFKIITLIILGVLFLGVSYIYNRFNIKEK